MVEIMVVIAIIVVIASLAVPVSLRARVQANETAAMGNLRTISSAAEAFRSGQNPPVYSDSLAQMASSSPPYLDSAWNTGNQRQGYVYTYAVATDRETYSTSATPRTANVSGNNSYCVDQTGVIRRSANSGSVGGERGCDASGIPI